jgi:hypothetical protein
LNNTLLNDQWVIKEVREEIKSFLEVNENEHTTYQNLWDTAEAVPKGKFIAMNAYIKSTGRSQMYDLMLHLKLLEKQEQAKPKTSRRSETIKIRAKINKIETKKYIQRINERKSWFFEKINKIDKHLANLMTKMRREKIHISKIRNEKGEITTNTKEIQEIIRDYFENIYSNKLENLEEMGKKYIYIHPKLNQVDINHLNSSITGNKIKMTIKSLPKKKSPGCDGFSAEFYQTFKEKLIPTLLKIFHELEMEGTCSNSFYGASITLIPSPDKDTSKKNYRSISLISIDEKIINKIIKNQIQQYIRKIIHHDYVSFIPGKQRMFNIRKSLNVVQHINISKDKKKIT